MGLLSSGDLICSLFVLWIQGDPRKSDTQCPGLFQDIVLMPDDYGRRDHSSVFYLLGRMIRRHIDAVTVTGLSVVSGTIIITPFKGFSGKLGRSVSLPRSHPPGVTAETTLGAPRCSPIPQLSVSYDDDMTARGLSPMGKWCFSFLPVLIQVVLSPEIRAEGLNCRQGEKTCLWGGFAHTCLAFFSVPSLMSLPR